MLERVPIRIRVRARVDETLFCSSSHARLDDEVPQSLPLPASEEKVVELGGMALSNRMDGRLGGEGGVLPPLRVRRLS